MAWYSLFPSSPCESNQHPSLMTQALEPHRSEFQFWSRYLITGKSPGFSLCVSNVMMITVLFSDTPLTLGMQESLRNLTGTAILLSALHYPEKIFLPLSGQILVVNTSLKARAQS